MSDGKVRINKILGATIGYHLTKGEPGVERARADASLRQQVKAGTERAQQQLNNANRRVEGLVRQLDQLRTSQNERLAAEQAEREADFALPTDLDADSRETILAVRKKTKADYESLYAVITAVRHVTRGGIGGAIVDCGAGRGGSTQAAARTLLELGDGSREIYVVDSFGATSAGAGSDEASALESAVADTDYPAQHIHALAGDIRDTVWAQLPADIAVLRIDVQDYRVADQELHQLWERVVPAGVVIIDGFGRGDQAQIALDELLARTPERTLFVRAGTARVAAKALA